MKKIKKEKKEKPKKEKKSIWKMFLSLFFVLAIIAVSAGLMFVLYIVITSPDFVQQKLYQKEPTILYDRYGNELAKVGQANSTILTYDELPEVLIDAIVATEDSRFFQHNGLDLFRFLKASVYQLLGKSGAGGASTLSMQVIKNSYTSKVDTGIEGIIRKFTDIYMAVFKLEANYTKEEIIEFYCNSQWFANDGDINVNGIIGIEQASQYFFGKSSKDINLAEAALLAGMFQNTRTRNPYNYPENARKRQETVLNLMVRHGYITSSQRDEALAIPLSSMLVSHEKTGLVVNNSQAFVDYVLKEVEDKTGLNPYNTSLVIYTTFDPNIQNVLERAENGEFYQYPDDVVKEGIAVTSTEDGSIVAISGGRHYQPKGTIYGSDIRRQPGSTAKPIFDYSMYIEHISQSTYAMVLDDVTTYSTGQRINNYDNAHRGLITMRYALSDSRNVPALRTFRKVYNLDKSIIENFVHSVGIDYGSELYESFSIGAFTGVSPLQLSAAYATFGRGGYYIEPYSYTKIINNATGEEINYSYSKEKVMEESTAYMISSILMDAYGGRGVSGTTIGGKTGTTNLDSETKRKYGLPSGAVMDAWIVSYSPSYSVALWYGYDSLTAEMAQNKYYLTSNTGGTARRQIMNGLATNIHRPNEQFKVPKTITKVNVETETFPPALCSSHTPSSMCVSEYFVAGVEPTEVSNRYSDLDNPINGRYTFNGSTITISWDSISTPDAINPTYLREHFNTYYEEYADKYYENRLNYINNNIGTLGYEIYLRNKSGSLTYVGYTHSTSFNYTVDAGGSYDFVVKSAYSIFKDNMSSGLVIHTKTIDSTVGDLVTDEDNNDNDSDNNN